MSRWIRLAAAVVAMIQISNLQYAWTIFVQPLRSAHPDWSLTDVQWGFSIFIAMETWAMPLTGWLIDKHGPRLLMSMGGVLCAVGWAGIGNVHSVLALYLLYGLAGLGAAIVYCGSIGVALKWFPDRRGLAAGMIAAGFGSGATIIMIVNSIPSVRDYALANFASTFLFTGVLQGLLIIVAAQFLGAPYDRRSHGAAVLRITSKAACSDARSAAHVTVSTSSSAASSAKRWRSRFKATTTVSGRQCRRAATNSNSPGATSRARNGSSNSYIAAWPVCLASLPSRRSVLVSTCRANARW